MENEVTASGLYSSNLRSICPISISGNNVIAYKGTQSVTILESSPDTFDYPYNVTIGPTEGGNLDAIRTNAFYIINKVHDFAYKYGWIEASYSFQTNNSGKGGAQGVRVLMSVQDASGANNVHFATRPEYDCLLMDFFTDLGLAGSLGHVECTSGI